MRPGTVERLGSERSCEGLRSAAINLFMLVFSSPTKIKESDPGIRAVISQRRSRGVPRFDFPCCREWEPFSPGKGVKGVLAEFALLFQSYGGSLQSWMAICPAFSNFPKMAGSSGRPRGWRVATANVCMKGLGAAAGGRPAIQSGPICADHQWPVVSRSAVGQRGAGSGTCGRGSGLPSELADFGPFSGCCSPGP
ncbi:hypothetical protein VTI74DRAFT_3158 [Chaetomium olivicolor]